MQIICNFIGAVSRIHSNGFVCQDFSIMVFLLWDTVWNSINHIGLSKTVGAKNGAKMVTIVCIVAKMFAESMKWQQVQLLIKEI